MNRRGFIKTLFLSSSDHEAGNGPVFNHEEANKLGDAINSLGGLTADDVRGISQPSSILTVRVGGREAGFFHWHPDSVADEDGCVVNDVRASGLVIKPFGRVGPGRWLREYRNTVSVWWFGAQGDGVTDDTAAFNAATQASVPYLQGLEGSPSFSNNSYRKREVAVPAVEFSYLLKGTVYIRKGQHLLGAGLGPSRIKIPVALAGITFKLGQGLIESVPVADEGGLPASISNLATEGGAIYEGVINANGIAGATIADLFITTASIGIEGHGGDITISRVTIDDGGTGIRSTGSRNVISGCSFFNNNFGIRVLSGCYDLVIEGNVFAYSKFADIEIKGESDSVRAISISGNNFTANAQLATIQASIWITEGNPQLSINGNTFSNLRGHAVKQITGEACNLSIKGNILNGVKAHPNYIQGSTMEGFYLRNGVITAEGNEFNGIFGHYVTLNNTDSDSVITIKRNKVTGIQNTSDFLHVLAYGGSQKNTVVSDNECFTEGVSLLGGPQEFSTNMELTMNKNNGFWGEVIDGGRVAIKIPTVNSAAFLLRVSYNGASSGSALYRKSALIAIEKGVSFDSSVKDFVTFNKLTLDSPGTIPGVLDVDVELDGVGSGNSLVYSQDRKREVVVSVPASGTSNIKFELL